MSESAFNWGDYTEGAGGGEFLTEEETLKLVVSGEAFSITGVRDGTSGVQYGSKPTYVLDFVTGDGEDKSKSFTKGINERDARFERIKSTLAATGEPITARLIKVGRRYDITGV